MVKPADNVMSVVPVGRPSRRRAEELTAQLAQISVELLQPYVIVTVSQGLLIEKLAGAFQAVLNAERQAIAAAVEDQNREAPPGLDPDSYWDGWNAAVKHCRHLVRDRRD